jgi:hypothetical protein
MNTSTVIRGTLPFRRRRSAQEHDPAPERMQKELQPEFDVLYTLQGFQYCDWLLAPAERATWQSLLRSPGVSYADAQSNSEDPATICAEVQRRAERTLTWVTPQKLRLEIALDHLTLARVGLVRVILEHPLPHPTLDLPQITIAVDGIRDSGNIDLLPKALLTAALYHFVRGDDESAHTSLGRAQQIAERGPMPLYLADVHLHRARLFRNRVELAQARALIEKHGYWRRKEELEDAEEAAKNWPASDDKRDSVH